MKLKFRNSIYLTKEEMLKVADLAGGQSMSDYMEQVIREHISQPTLVAGDVLESCGLCRNPKNDCICHATRW